MLSWAWSPFKQDPLRLVRSLAAACIHHWVFGQDTQLHSTMLILCLSLFGSASSAYILFSSSRSSSYRLPFSKAPFLWIWSFSDQKRECYRPIPFRHFRNQRPLIPILTFFLDDRRKVDVTATLCHRNWFCPTHPHVSVQLLLLIYSHSTIPRPPKGSIKKKIAAPDGVSTSYVPVSIPSFGGEKKSWPI